MSEKLKPLFESAIPLDLKNSQMLFHAGDAVERIYLLEEGAVKLLRYTVNGDALTLQTAAAGDILAEASVYSDRYHCSAVAQGQVRVLGLSVASFRAELAKHPVAAEAWAAGLAHAIQNARLRAEIRTLKTVAERLDAWLGEERGLPPKGQWQDLAQELSVTREALYRELSKRRRLNSRRVEPHPDP